MTYVHKWSRLIRRSADSALAFGSNWNKWRGVPLPRHWLNAIMNFPVTGVDRCHSDLPPRCSPSLASYLQKGLISVQVDLDIWSPISGKLRPRYFLSSIRSCNPHVQQPPWQISRSIGIYSLLKLRLFPILISRCTYTRTLDKSNFISLNTFRRLLLKFKRESSVLGNLWISTWTTIDATKRALFLWKHVSRCQTFYA